MLSHLLGGIGLFLLGMGLLTDGLKVAGGKGLERVLARVTGSRWRALFAGAFVTAIVQSSSAVTIATIGFVNAGLMGLAASMWVTFGSNVGTTMTGWLVAIVGVKLDIGAFALPLVGIGMVMRIAARNHVRIAGLGQAVAGFGALFLGIAFLTEGFAGARFAPADLGIDPTHWTAVPAFVAVGAVLTVITRSSSAAIAIVLTASAGDGLPLAIAAATVIGTNIGTTSTAVFAAIGATAPARRVAAAHIAFNLGAAAIALLALPWFLAASRGAAGLVGRPDDLPLVLAMFHTLFNVTGVLSMWPFADVLRRWLERRFVTIDEELGRPRHLDANLAGVPALALRGLAAEVTRLIDMAFATARVRVGGGAPDVSILERREEGARRLGAAIRDFLGRLNRGAMPEDVASAIPDVIRAVQHVEEVTDVASQLAGAEPRPPDSVVAAELEALRQAALDALISVGGVDPATPDDRLIESVETRYQAAKGALLTSAAHGRMRVEAMEARLLEARRLRRCAEAALKARRRLGRWAAKAPAPAS